MDVDVDWGSEDIWTPRMRCRQCVAAAAVAVCLDEGRARNGDHHAQPSLRGVVAMMI